MSHFDTLQTILADTLLIPKESIRPDDELAQLKNMDSLTFEMVLVAIEKQTGKVIDTMDLVTVKTVSDLARTLG